MVRYFGSRNNFRPAFADQVVVADIPFVQTGFQLIDEFPVAMTEVKYAAIAMKVK